MKLEDQIKAAAELDGIQVRMRYVEGYKVPFFWEYLRHPELEDDWCLWEVKPYPTSYDATIPCIVKANRWEEVWKQFKHDKHPPTPAQLLEALLRATGKWKE